MDILDILIAKNQSFTAETAKLTKQAQAAMAKANEVAAKIDEAQEALDAAEAANTRAQEVAAEFDTLKSDVDAAVSDIVDEKIATVTEDITTAKSDAAEAKETAAEAVTEVEVIDANTSTAKVKKVRTRKKGIAKLYDTVKNYMSTGTNEDGGMTQKAITNALNAQKTELENKIKNIKPSGGSSGISGDISAEDEGSIIAVGENGNITPSSITEVDIVKTQILTGTYKNDNIVGLEIDYANKSFKRLQGASNLTAGTGFDKFNMFGGRKRCIVNKDGSIVKFIDNTTDRSELTGKRIMVYQPAFYYLRFPVSTTSIDAGVKINKEHVYVSDTKYAGFTLHPAFIDDNGNALKFILLPAFESAAMRVSNNEVVTNDAQDVDLNNDSLISTIDIKPISGYTQDFNYFSAQKMCQNNGTGWDMTDLAYESLNQMLMIIEYGSMNLQNALNAGITKNTNTVHNNACITGSTFDLYNNSGRASSTISDYDGSQAVQTADGRCAVSYRGVENPYGGIWRFVNNVRVDDGHVIIKDTTTNHILALTSGWISAMGYYSEFDWAFLPILIDDKANSNVPVGDYVYASENSYMTIGGSYAADINAGPFNYHYRDIMPETRACNESARIMFKPTANSTIETTNYRAWINN